MNISILYKYISLLLLLLLVRLYSIQAQNTPLSGKQVNAIPIETPIRYTTTTVNYVRTWEPSMPSIDLSTIMSESRTVAEVKQASQYFDGLGRPLQTVSKGISPDGRDMVAPVIYDAYGREQFKYLPYTQQTGNTSDGKFKTDPFVSQQAFYQNGTLNPGAIGETIYYGQVEYEASPLNRVLKTYAPGNSWALEGGKRPVEQQYLTNALTDAVRIWKIASTGMPTSTGIYDAAQLYKQLTIEESGNQIVEYKDKEGRVILKKVQLDATPGTGHEGWLCTYYVYDDYGNLRFVIPPLAVEKLLNNWNVSLVADELCFQYEYDNRNRMIVKKVPGAGPVHMVYDIYDRLVFTQDAVQRSKSTQEWLVTFYDDLNRPEMTAIYKANVTRETLQASMNTDLSSTPIPANLVVTSYDGRSSYVASNSISFEDNFDTGIGATVTAEIYNGGTGGTGGSTTNPVPAIPSSDLTPLTYTFYDNYNYTGKFSYEASDIAKPQAGNNPYAEGLSSSPSSMTRGLVTGSKVRILGTDQWLTTTTYYNDKGRAIQVIADNSVGGKDIATTLYDFNGKVLSNYLRHGNPRSVLTPQTTVLTMLSYDAGGRLLSVKKRLNDDASQDKTIVANTYDELGQLKQKRLGVTGTSSQLDSLSYTYNIRGWLQGINKAFVNTTNSKVNWFGQELNYDYGFSTNQYNGNIAGVKWKSGSDGIARAYGYNYDRVNRLTVADFTQQNTNEVAWTRNKMDFSVSNLTYDANGNIKTMNQQGMIGAAINQIDKLTYSYSSSGSNKLLSVSDASNTASAKLGDFIDGTNTGNDYSYDNNGNLVTDQNKGISTISYNHLNLPSTILITGKGSINYLYDAAGNKLKKTVVDNTVTPSKTTITDYIGGFVYKQDTLELVSHEEGRIRPVYVSGQPVKYSFDYFEKDHLGNVRVVLTDQTDFSVYSATMETAVAAKETALFSNVEETRAEKPVGYPEDGTTDTNAFVAKLNAKTGGKKIGPSLVLRVMAGDTVQINAKAFYKSGGPQDNGATPPVEDMLAGLVQAFSSGTAADGSHATAGIDNATPFNSDFYNNSYRQLKEKNPDAANPDRPKAYLNFVLFDDQFKLVDDNSGVRQVKATPDELQELKVEPVVMEKSGFLYVYTSNETEQDVFFDNVILGLASGPVLEETHYYPFGLTMAGISSNALKGANYPENRKKYNGIEFTDDLDLDIYDAQLRNLDPQIGRWNQVDPKTENMEMWSPYVSNYNNPIRYNDFLGDEPGDGPGFLDRLGNAVVQMGQQVLSAGAGAANAFVSNHLLGGGRIAAENTGLVGGNAIAYQVGQKIGDAAAAVAGAAETITAVGGEVLSAGIATPVAIPLAIEGVTTAALGLKNAFTNPIRNITLEDRAAKLNKKDRSGKDFTPAGREVVKEQNKVKNEGTMKCENCGVETPNAQKSKKGVTPPKNEAHVDHIKRKREGGRGNPDNGQVLCGGCNVEKH